MPDSPSHMSPFILQDLNQQPIVRELAPIPWSAGLTNSTLGLNTLYFVPFDIGEGMYVSRLAMFLSLATTFSATNLAGTFGMTLSAALYSSNLSTGTGQAISRIWSQSAGYAFSQSSNSNLSATIATGIRAGSVATLSTTLATSNASTFMATSVGGFREVALPVGSTVQAGRYWLAVGYSTGAATAATFQIAASIMQQTMGNQIGFMPFGTDSSASGSGFQINPFLGSYSATSSGFPASLAVTNANVLVKPMITPLVPFFKLYGTPMGLSNL